MKPHLHAKNSVHDFGGRLEDYLAIHEFLDSSKSAHADMKHRAVLHSAFGIYICEQVFSNRGLDGEDNRVSIPWLVNSDGAKVHIRDVAENHVLEDLGKIPSLTDYLNHMQLATWMGGRVPTAKRFIKID